MEIKAGIFCMSGFDFFLLYSDYNLKCCCDPALTDLKNSIHTQYKAKLAVCYLKGRSPSHLIMSSPC